MDTWDSDIEDGGVDEMRRTCSCRCCCKTCFQGLAWLLSKVSITQLWAILAVLTLGYFFFGNSLSYQQGVEQSYQAKYASLKQQRDELVAMERYWAIEVEGLKKEEQRQMLERNKLEQRVANLTAKEKVVMELMRKEQEAHTPFQENGPNYVKYIMQNKCGGSEWLTNYSIMHKLRARGNLKPWHLGLRMSPGHSLADWLATMAHSFALSFSLGRAFYVDKSNSPAIFPLFDTLLVDWRIQPKLQAEPPVVALLPLSPEDRMSQISTSLLNGSTAAYVPGYLILSTSHLGTLESLHALAHTMQMPMDWHLEAGCILHQLITPSAAMEIAMQQQVPAISDADTFTVAIYAPHAQTLKWTLAMLFGCARNVTRFHALHGARVRWFLITDTTAVDVTVDAGHQVTRMLTSPDSNGMEADALALYTLAYSRIRILTEGLLGRMGALMSLRFGATYYLPSNSRCGPEDTTSLDDLEFTS